VPGLRRCPRGCARSIEQKAQPAARELVAGGPTLADLEGTPVPHKHGSRAVLSVRYHAFEIRVLDWMIFGLHGQALVVGTQRRPFRHGPRREHAVDFKAKIIM